MTPDEYATALTDALVAEIRAEMGRRDMRTIRELAKAAGMTETAVQDRLNKNSRTGRRTPIKVTELPAIAQALRVDATDLFRRAMAAVDDGDPPGGASANPGTPDAI